MKFVINDDKLKIELSDTINSGSFRDYLMPVETDESWQGLSIEAIISKKDSNEGIARAVINNEVYIDMPKKERYTIGFIGYTIENNEKIHQKSTDLKIIPIVKGAGEIEATNTEEVPTQSEWEVYLSLVQEFIDNGNTILSQAENVNVSLDGQILTVTNKNGETTVIDVKGDKGDKGDDGNSGLVIFEIQDGHLIAMSESEETLRHYHIENGHLILDLDDEEIDLGEVKGKSAYEIWLDLGNTGTEQDFIDSLVGGGQGTTNYNLLENKPKVNNVELSGNKTSSDLGLQPEINSESKLSSDLIDDTNKTNKFVTTQEKEAWNNKSNFSGNYNDLSNKPTIPTVPTNVSAFTNDAGYLTQHQDISGKLDNSKVQSTYSTTSGDVYDVTYINTMVGNIETLLGGI